MFTLLLLNLIIPVHVFDADTLTRYCKSDQHLVLTFLAHIQFQPINDPTALAITTHRAGQIRTQIDPDWTRLNSVDQLSVLCHEFIHYRDFSDPKLRLLLQSLPQAVARAVMEIRAVSFIAENAIWPQMGPGRRRAEGRLLRQSKQVVRAWLSSNAPYGVLSLKRIAEGMSESGQPLSTTASIAKLRQIKTDFLALLVDIRSI